MKRHQEPKYDACFVGENGEDTAIFNRASGEMIPSDEPIMIFRARDIHAWKVIREYADMVRDDDHRAVVLERMEDFIRFERDHSERMKEPDTARAELKD